MDTGSFRPDDAAMKRRAVEPYLKFVRTLDSAVPIETRVGHILDEFDRQDFDTLRQGLADAGATAGLSVPAIYLSRIDWLADVLRGFVDDGNELVVHGIRHTSYMDTDYETARGEIREARRTLGEAMGTDPTGFQVPYGRVSPETIRAAGDAGIEWIVGTATDESTGTGTPPVTTPVQPYDLHRIERGSAPVAAFDGVMDDATDESVVLFHPNVAAHHDALDDFVGWLADQEVRTPSALVDGRGSGPGLLLDVFPPFSIA